MEETVRIRPFRPSDWEYDAVADVAMAFAPELLGDFEYSSGADIRALDGSFAMTQHTLRRYVAEEIPGGQIVGYAQLFHIPWLPRPGCVWSSIRVRPGWQRRGIGARLYTRVLQDLTEHGAAAVWLMVHETMPEIAARAERAGFRELFRSWPFCLNISSFDATLFHAVLDRVAARGFEITTLSEVQRRDQQWLPKLYELHCELTREIPLPGHPHPEPPLEWFVDFISRSPASLPDAFFVALDGDRYIGESFMQPAGGAPGALSHKVTGVRRAYRGCGLAPALKLKTIDYAQRHGYAQIWTAVESNNPSMLAINQKLGFVRGPGLILFEKRLDRETPE